MPPWSKRPQTRNAHSPPRRKSRTASVTVSVCWRHWLPPPFLFFPQSGSGGAARIVGASVFAATMVLLYLTSTLYHALPGNRAKRVFQVLDHAAIFLMIAGTYTPFTLGVLRGTVGLDAVRARVGSGPCRCRTYGDRRGTVPETQDRPVYRHGLARPHRGKAVVAPCAAVGSVLAIGRWSSRIRRAWRSMRPSGSATATSSGTCSLSRAPHVISSRCCGTRPDRRLEQFGGKDRTWDGNGSSFRLGVFSGSEKRDGVCQVLTDAGQQPFSHLGEDKIRGSSDKKEE